MPSDPEELAARVEELAAVAHHRLQGRRAARLVERPATGRLDPLLEMRIRGASALGWALGIAALRVVGARAFQTADELTHRRGG